MEKAIKDNYHEGLGIEILTVAETSKKFDEEDSQLQKIDVAEFGFTEAFDLLVKNEDEEKVSGLCLSMQLSAQASLSSFIDDMQYIFSRFEEKDDVLDSRRFTLTYWLKDNDTLTAEISYDEVAEVMEEIEASEATKEKVRFAMDLTQNRAQESCDNYLEKITKMI